MIQKILKYCGQSYMGQAVCCRYFPCSTCTNVLCPVRLNGHQSESLNVISGHIQGCPLTPMLYNQYIYKKNS